MNVAYLRVSTEAQTEKYGLDMQKQKILDYCEQKGVVIDRWYIDGGYSGSKLERPEIQRLLDDAKDGDIKRVFIYKLDRMSRDVIDTLTLLYRVLPMYGVEVVSMTEDLRFENPMDKVTIGINAIIGQYEREMIMMRSKAGRKERARVGKWKGGGNVPFGYRYDRNDEMLHPVKEQVELVRQAYRLYISGYSCENIAKMLGFAGEPTVRSVLTKKTNIGLIEYKGEFFKGLHEPIIDEETFYRAQECMKKRHTNSHINNDNMLTGLCWCGICGARMRYQKWGKYHKLCCYSQYKTSKEYLVRDPNCNNERVFAYDVEAEVENCFKQFIISLDEEQEFVSNISIIEDSIKKCNAKIKKYYALYAENDSENLFDLIREEEQKLKSLKEQLVSEREKENKQSNSGVDEIKRIADGWGEMTNREKNRVLKTCVERITITGNDYSIRFTTF